MVTTYTAQDKRDNIGASETFTVTAWTEDLTLDATETTAANIAATLATLIKVLQNKGIIGGTTAST